MKAIYNGICMFYNMSFDMEKHIATHVIEFTYNRHKNFRKDVKISVRNFNGVGVTFRPFNAFRRRFSRRLGPFNYIFEFSRSYFHVFTVFSIMYTPIVLNVGLNLRPKFCASG